MIRLRGEIRSVSILCRISRPFETPGPTGVTSAGLFLAMALVTNGAESVPAPPASDHPVTVVPLFPTDKPAASPDRSPPETVQPLPPVAGDGVSDRVSRIDTDTDPTQESEGPAIPSTVPTPPVPAAAVPPARRPSTPIVERAEILQRDKEQRFDRLRGQLQDLIEKWEVQQKQLRDQRAQRQPQRAAAPPTDTVPTQPPGTTEILWSDDPETHMSGPDVGAPNPSATPGATQTVEAPAQDSPQLRQEQSPQAPPDQSPTAPSRPEPTQTSRRAPTVPLPPSEEDGSTGIPGLEGMFAGPVVAEGPIDRLGLADSLFASGENALALELYRQLETGSDRLESHDRYWVRYQIGCCYRRLNNIDEAQKWYRGIVADKEAGWIGELARWWLDHLEERFRMRGGVQELQQTVQALEKQVNEQLDAAN